MSQASAELKRSGVADPKLMFESIVTDLHWTALHTRR